MRKANVWILVLAFSTIFLFGCGKEEEAQWGIDGYVYLARELNLVIQENEVLSNWQTDGEYLYYHSYSGGSTGYVYRIPIKEEINLSDREPVIDSYYYAIDSYQNIYYIDNDEREDILVQQSAYGEEVYRLSLPATVKSLLAGEDGRVYLLSDASIYVVDVSEDFFVTIPIEENIHVSLDEKSGSLLRGEGGRIYYVLRDLSNEQKFVYELIERDTFQLSAVEALNCGRMNQLYSSDHGLLKDGENGILSQYDAEVSSFTELFKWNESGLNGLIQDIIQVDEERFLVCYMWGISTGQEKGVYLLTKTPVEELPKKEVLVLAAVSPSQVLINSVAEFNRTNDQYQINILLYEGSEGVNRLDAALSSSNPPDLLDLDYLDITKYAGHQVLEDLTPYLEASSKIHKEDYLKSVIEGYTFGKKLVCIPNRFYFDAIFSRDDQIGPSMGWSLEDVKKLAGRNPNCRMFHENSLEAQLRYVYSYFILENFVDWENGTCQFDSEEFKSLILWIIDHSSDDEAFQGLLPEDVLCRLNRSIGKGSDYYWNELCMGGKGVIKGCPTVDGSAVFPARAVDTVCIVSKSEHKEGAWRFLEFFLQKDEKNASLEAGFPTRKSSLLKMLEEEMTPDYVLGENGEVITGADGESGMKAKFFMELEGELFPYYCMTHEQADTILQATEYLEFNSLVGVRANIIAIIEEELQSYLNGDKTMEAVTEVIQSKGKLLLAET